MTRNVKHTNTSSAFSKAATSKKPYCKVCFDAGKSESEYTSHWVRSLPDKYGKTTVTCPTLLSTRCRFCYMFGHTTKFCPAAIKQTEQFEKIEWATEQEYNKPKPKNNSSRFSVLNDDSDEEEPQKPTWDTIAPKIHETNDAKMVSFTEKDNVEPQKPTWASIAAKPAKAVETNDLKMVSLTEKDNDNLEPVVEEVTKVTYVGKSWADWTESESESDNDDYLQVSYNDDDYDDYIPVSYDCFKM